MKSSCHECGALMFEQEKCDPVPGNTFQKTFSLCCAYGAIKLPPIKEPPEKLKSLLTGNTKCHQEFRTNIQAYNSSLAFASMCLTGDEYKFKNHGPYCYRINGQVYHTISQMQLESGKRPLFPKYTLMTSRMSLKID